MGERKRERWLFFLHMSSPDIQKVLFPLALDDELLSFSPPQPPLPTPGRPKERTHAEGVNCGRLSRTAIVSSTYMLKNKGSRLLKWLSMENIVDQPDALNSSLTFRKVDRENIPQSHSLT